MVFGEEEGMKLVERSPIDYIRGTEQGMSCLNRCLFCSRKRAWPVPVLCSAGGKMH